MTDLDDLESKARAAIEATGGGNWTRERDWIEAIDSHAFVRPHAAAGRYILAANPAAIIKLVERLRAAEGDVAVLKKNDQDACDMRYSTMIERDMEMQKVVDGIKAQAAVNEAIVRDLADTDPVIREHFESDGVKSGRDHCSLCVSDGGFGSEVYHEHECPWRRAVEAKP